MNTPPITAAPEMNAAVKGMVSLRGALVPVVDLWRLRWHQRAIRSARS
jgi:two-component system chemotaxis response regulator CheV